MSKSKAYNEYKMQVLASLSLSALALFHSLFQQLYVILLYTLGSVLIPGAWNGELNTKSVLSTNQIRPKRVVGNCVKEDTESY